MDRSPAEIETHACFLIRKSAWQRPACSLAGASALIVLLAVALHLQSRTHGQHAAAAFNNRVFAQGNMRGDPK